MKKLTSYNRAAGYLNRIFDLLNQEYFEGELSRPTITIQSTPKAYGHFSLRDDTWVSVTGNSHEINIGAGTLARPIENVVCTMLHEMVHYYNYINGIQDSAAAERTIIRGSGMLVWQGIFWSPVLTVTAGAIRHRATAC